MNLTGNAATWLPGNMEESKPVKKAETVTVERKEIDLREELKLLTAVAAEIENKYRECKCKEIYDAITHLDGAILALASSRN